MKNCFYDFCDNQVEDEGSDFCSDECSIDFDRLAENVTDTEIPHEDDECGCDDCQN